MLHRLVHWLLAWAMSLTLALPLTVEASPGRGFFSQLNVRRWIRDLNASDNPLLERILRPMEFRDPIVSMPAEGRYGWGVYGWKGLDPTRLGEGQIVYDTSSVPHLTDSGWSGRFGHTIEAEGIQTNLAYLLFRKSYVDVLSGIGVRSYSTFPVPNVKEEGSERTGPPEIPEEWGVENYLFAPSLQEVNLGTSLIAQWSPKWFLHFRYSYGATRARFFRKDVVEDTPSGTGTTSSYGVGIKLIRDTEGAARMSFGVELRHFFHRIDAITDPGGLTPITAFQVPALGIFFTFGAFYGGEPSIGDEGKALYLNGDYIAARRKLSDFLETHPRHARARRARKLMALCDERIPAQLAREAAQLEAGGNVDGAFEKIVEASRTAGDSLAVVLQWKLDEMSADLLRQADAHLQQGKEEEALTLAQKAARVSERGRIGLKKVEALATLKEGRDLSYRGLYDRALEKYSHALVSDPTLQEEVRRLQMEAAVGMLEDANRASDEASLRLAVESLQKAGEILGVADRRREEVIRELQRQLASSDTLRIRARIAELAEQARQEKARAEAAQLSLGMLVAEVEAIAGRPDHITERVDEKGRNYQLWSYVRPGGGKMELYFEDYTLFRLVEE